MPSLSNPSSGDLDRAARTLEYLTRKLRLLGMLLPIVTAIHPFLFIWNKGDRFGTDFGVLAAGILAFSSVVIAVCFELLRKRGDVLFKEISDELQWNVRFSKRSRSIQPTSNQNVLGDHDQPVQSRTKRPELATRVMLRSYANAADLPLVPGKFGPLFYVVVNAGLAGTMMLPLFESLRKLQQ